MSGFATTVAVIGPAGAPAVDAVRRLCAAAGVEAVPAHDSAAALAAWRSCRAVVVAVPSAEWVASCDRRDAVVLVADDAAAVDVWRHAVAVGAEAVFVAGRDETALLEWLALAVEPTGRGDLLAVVAGCGGAGASTLACAVAVTAAADEQVTLVDADPLAGGVDLVLGAEREPGSRWPDLVGSRGVVASSALRSVLPAVAGLSLLSWVPAAAGPAPDDAVECMVDAALRGSDLVVLDLPRCPGEALRRAAVRARIVVVVVPAAVRAVAAASGIVARWREAGAEVGIAVRHPGPADLSPELVARAVEAPLICVLPDDRRLAALGDRGQFVRALRRSPLAGAALAARRSARAAA